MLASLASTLTIIIDSNATGPVLTMATTASIGLVVVARPGSAGVFLFFAEDIWLGKVFLCRQDLPKIVYRDLGIPSGIVWLGRQSDLARHQLR